MSYEKNVVSLTLKSVEPILAGSYYCHATNIHGTAVLSLRVLVESGKITFLKPQSSSFLEPKRGEY